MATKFRTKELQNLSTTMTALSGVFTAGDVTVHAIYVSNTHSTNTIGFNLSLHDNQDPSQEKAKILHQVEIAPKSTLVIEKPINLTTSTSTADAWQLKVSATQGTDLDVVASVLEIT